MPLSTPLTTAYSHICSGNCVPHISTSLLLVDTHTHTHTPAAVDCGPLDEPRDGYITYSETTTLGSVAEYFCDFGYTLDQLTMAPPLRMCTSSGEWDSTARSCTREGSTAHTAHYTDNCTANGQ